MPLSEAATGYLIQLPYLSHWVTVRGSPRVVPTSIFPSLENVRLNKQGALLWLRLLASHERGVLRGGSASVVSRADIRGTTKFLECPSTIVHSTFLSSVVKFRNLVMLFIRDNHCSDMESCTFRLSDDNMENLTTTLPRLENLRLG